jgi:hypothetical protein
VHWGWEACWDAVGDEPRGICRLYLRTDLNRGICSLIYVSAVLMRILTVTLKGPLHPFMP